MTRLQIFLPSKSKVIFKGCIVYIIGIVEFNKAYVPI